MNRELGDGITEEVGKKIRDIRKEKGITQQELADKIGADRSLISKIEKGAQNMTLITLKKIADALSENISIIFFR